MIGARRMLVVVAAGALVVTGTAACTGDDDAPGPSRSAVTVAAPLTVDTTGGSVRGVAAGGAREFLGVRYGRAVAGERRWTLPQAAPRASGTADATKPGPSCAQAGTAPGASATASTSEDCLFLNVTTPRTLRPGERLPVMVWWHGGGFTSGSGAAYGAQRLAERGRVAVVTVNYRLGVFGYLALPGLEGGGNFGLADQLLATRWAKHNAAAFGGDPSNITVFGESAGAMSACAALTSPAAKGLVDKVAMSSGGACQLRWPDGGLVPGAPAQTPTPSLADAEQLGASEAEHLRCTDVTCLRGRSTKQLLTIFPAFSNALAYGTPLLPTDPAAAVLDGKALPVPVLSTGNRDEERAFVGGAQKVKPFFTAATYPTLLRTAFGSAAARVAREYPLGRYPDAATAWASVITDASWACPTVRGNQALADGGSRVYGGEFADTTAPDVNGVRTRELDPGAAHASDVPYLFDLTGKDLLRTAAQRRLSEAMIDYYTSFARTGTPSAAGGPAWPQLADGGGELTLATPMRVGDVADEHRCSFWATVRF